MLNVLPTLRLASRALIRRPGFSAAAVLTLALGVGANTAIFSVINAVALRPLAVSSADELVSVFAGSDHSAFGNTSYPDFRVFQEQNRTLSGMYAYVPVSANVEVAGSLKAIPGELISEDYFSVLGLRPHLGRLGPLESGEVVLARGFWRQSFGENPEIIGTALELNGRQVTVIGVAPLGFRGLSLSHAPDVWLSARDLAVFLPGLQGAQDQPHWQLFSVGGRMRPDTGIATVQADLEVIARRITEVEGGDVERVVTVLPAHDARVPPALRGRVFSYSGLLVGVVGIVFLVACLNVANLLVARIAARGKEIAVRKALGASSGRLLFHLTSETLLLALAGGATGILVAVWATGYLSTVHLPGDLALNLDLRPDGRVLLFTLATSILTGLLLGCVATWRALRTTPSAALRPGTPGAPAIRKLGVRGVLISAQIALSVVLLMGAGLLLRTLHELRRVDPGFRPEGVLSLTLDPGLAGYDEQRGRLYFRQLLEEVAAIPEVASVGLVKTLPVQTDGKSLGAFLEGSGDTADEMNVLPVNLVSVDYFQTLGIPLLRGRAFSEDDRQGAPRVAIVSESLAKRFWPGEYALGKRFGYSGPGDRSFEIVGVVGDVRVGTLRGGVSPVMYHPHAQVYDLMGAKMELVIRTGADPGRLVADVQRSARVAGPEVAILSTRTLTQHLQQGIRHERQAAKLLALFAVVALILASIGLYGVIAHAVAQRVPEIGIRLALGATGRGIAGLFLRHGMVLTLIGLGLGIPTALATARLLTGLLFGVSPADPWTLTGISLLLGMVAVLACSLPAHRAARLDPMVALRYE